MEEIVYLIINEYQVTKNKMIIEDNIAYYIDHDGFGSFINYELGKTAFYIKEEADRAMINIVKKAIKKQEEKIIYLYSLIK